MLILENKALNLHSSLKHSIHKLQIMLSETHTHTRFHVHSHVFNYQRHGGTGQERNEQFLSCRSSNTWLGLQIKNT